MNVASVKAMQASDRRTIEEIGIPGLLLMEAAALELCRVCLSKLDNKGGKILIFAGGGNNGGDGLALARLLYNKKIDVEIIFLGKMEKVKGDAGTELNIIGNLPIKFSLFGDEQILDKIQAADIIVDAIYGIGLRDKIDGLTADLITEINEKSKYIIAADMPSGINGDTGAVMGTAVKADTTVTFGLPKAGLLLYPGAEYAGELIVADIGIPEKIIETTDSGIYTLNAEEWRCLLPKRFPRSNKGSYGKLLVIAGSKEMPGASVLLSRAASKAGAGLVCAALAESWASAFQSGATECTTKLLPESEGELCYSAWEHIRPLLEKHTAVAIGPGLGQGIQISNLLIKILKELEKPLILDADGLTGIAGCPEILIGLKAPCIITPHPGEMSRLTGLPVNEILSNSLETAKRYAKEWKVIVVLKDAHTITAAPDGRAYINTTGNAGMAKAGAGDVLTGIIGAFLAQGLEPFTAAYLGVYVHGMAGDLAAARLGMYGVLPEDIAECVGLVLAGVK